MAQSPAAPDERAHAAPATPGLFARLPVELALHVAASGVLSPHDLLNLSQSCRDWHALLADEYVWHALAVRTLCLDSFHTPLHTAAAQAGLASVPPSWHDLIKHMEQLERQFGWTVVGDDRRCAPLRLAPLATTKPSVSLLSAASSASASASAGALWERAWLTVPEQRAVLVPNAPRTAAQVPTVHLIDTLTEYPMWSYTPTSPGHGAVKALGAVRQGDWLVMQWSWQSITRTQEKLWASVHKTQFDPSDICTGCQGHDVDGDAAPASALGWTWVRDVPLAAASAVPLDAPPVQLQYPHLLFLDTDRHVLTSHNVETGQIDLAVSWDHLLAPAFPAWDHRDACFRKTNTYQFALAGSHLFIMPGHRDLVALDIVTGEPIWSFSDMLAEIGTLHGPQTMPVSQWDLTIERPGSQPGLVPSTSPFPSRSTSPSPPETATERIETDKEDSTPSEAHPLLDHHLVSFYVDPASETLLLETVGGPSNEPHVWVVRHYLHALTGRRTAGRGRPWAACVRLVPHHGVTLNLDDQWSAAHGRAWIPLLLPRWTYTAAPPHLTTSSSAHPSSHGQGAPVTYTYTRRDDKKPLSSHLGFEKGYLCPLILDWKHAQSPAQLRATCLPTGPVRLDQSVDGKEVGSMIQPAPLAPSLPPQGQQVDEPTPLLAGLALTMYQVRKLPYSPYRASLLLTTFDTPARKHAHIGTPNGRGHRRYCHTDEWEDEHQLPEPRNILVDFNWGGPAHHHHDLAASHLPPHLPSPHSHSRSITLPA